MPVRLRRDTPPTWFRSSCESCHAGTESRSVWADFDISVEGEGDLLICLECIREAAGLAGMVSSEEADALLCRALEAEARVEAAELAATEARELVAALRRFDAGALPAPAVEAGSGPLPPSDLADRAAEVAAAAEAELAKGAVMPHACPAVLEAGIKCDRQFATSAAAGAHAFRAHGRRSSQ